MKIKEANLKRLAKLLDEVSEDRLIFDTREISKWVRITGSEEEKRAFDYIKERCIEAGASVKEYKPVIYSSVPLEARLRIRNNKEEMEIPCITHSMSPSTPPEGISGKLSPLEESSLYGKIALIKGVANPKSLLEATSKGAIGCVFLTETDPPPEMIVSPVWGSPTLEELKDLPKIPAVSVGSRFKERIFSLAKEGAEAKIFTKVKTDWTETSCLIAEIKPIEGGESFVLLSGHVDSWHYGAMDNATGNACQLEVLRIASLHREELKRSLRVAFWSGHSHGRYAGSTWYADHNYVDLMLNCVVHINADCLGAKGASIVTEGNVMAETKHVGEVIIKLVCDQKLNGTRFTRMGDQSFWGCGVPSLFVTPAEQPPKEISDGITELLGKKRSGGLGPWWHTPLDTMEIIDPANLVRDTKIILGVTWLFLTSPLIPLKPASSIEEIGKYLNEYKDKYHSHIDESMEMGVSLALNEALKLSLKIKEKLSKAEELFESLADSLPPEHLPLINRKIMEIERPLVRINYCKNPPYLHDPALPQPPVPLLPELEMLRSLDRDQKMAFLVGLRRRLNGVQEALISALNLAEDLLSLLKEG